MDDTTQSSGKALIYKGAAAVVLLLGTFVLFFKTDPEPPQAPLFDWGSPAHPASAITNGTDRLAILESFHSLDTYVADQCFAPVPLNPQQFESPRAHQLASRFLEDMAAYQSAEQLAAFINAAQQIMRGPQQAPPQVLEFFSQQPGSQSILDSEGNPEVLQATYQIANQRLQQLNSIEQIRLIQELTNEGLAGELERSGIRVTPADMAPADHGKLLRFWELTGTRYFICQTGNQDTSKSIQAKFPNPYRPVYINALNAVLDPVQRRFEAATSFEVDASSVEHGLKLLVADTGPLSLMVFKGALPQAKLYADWRSGLTADAAAELAYSPGFLPELVVAIHGKSLPTPEHPARTEDLDALIITKTTEGDLTATIPPLEFSTVLLVNNTVTPDWQALVGGNQTPIHRANLDAIGIFLPASAKERTVEFQAP